jgi:hypothetical protein
MVEPEGGLPQVDREFYVMQGELYTVEPFGTQGDMEMDYDKLISERPEYFLFNGAVGALTKRIRSMPMSAKRCASISASAARTTPRPSTSSARSSTMSTIWAASRRRR